MPAPFDPYYRWLAIPPEEQPPNHYRLLGVKLFEPSEDVISSAADQRMMHLRTFQTGAHAALSQRMLGEVAQAVRTLLDPGDRQAYDAALRAKTDKVPAARPAAALSMSSAMMFDDGAEKTPSLAKAVDKLAEQSADLTLLVEDLTTTTTPAAAAPPQRPAELGATERASQERAAAELASSLADIPDESIDTSLLARAAKASSVAPLVRPEPPKKSGLHPGILAAGGVAAVLVIYLLVATIVPSADLLGWFHSPAVAPSVADSTPRSKPVPAVSSANPIQAQDNPPTTDAQGKVAELNTGDSRDPLPKPSDINPTDPKPTDPKVNDSKIETPPVVEDPSPDVDPTPEKKPTDVPQKTTVAAKPKPPEPLDDPPRAVTWKDFPREFELPELKDRSAVLLANLPADTVIDRFNISGELARLADDEYFSIEPVLIETTTGDGVTVEAPSTWKIRLGRHGEEIRERPVLAELTRVADQIHFHWLETDHAEAALHLKNSQVELIAGGEAYRVALRKSVQIDPWILALDKSSMRQELKIGPLPKADYIIVQFGRPSITPRWKWVDDVRESPLTSPLRLAIQGSSKEPQAELKLEADASQEDQLVVSLSAVRKVEGGDRPWTMAALTEWKNTTNTDIDRAKRQAKIEDNALPGLRVKVGPAKKAVETATDKTYRKAANNLENIEKQIASRTKARDEQLALVKTLQARLDQLPAVESLMKALHAKAKLEFRIIARGDDGEIELVRTTGYRKP